MENTVFTLYTLDCTLEANEKSKKEDILKLAEGHILQKLNSEEDISANIDDVMRLFYLFRELDRSQLIFHLF